MSRLKRFAPPGFVEKVRADLAQRELVHVPPAPQPLAVVELPIPTINPLNAREHYMVRSRRTRSERDATAYLLRARRVEVPALPVRVHLVRLSAGELDSDSLPAAFKGVRDQLAVWLGLPQTRQGLADDRDPRVAWTYAQERAPRGTCAIRLEFYPRGAP